MSLEGVREAASIEGLIALAVFYFVINLIAKAGKAAKGRPASPPVEAGQPGGTQQEGFSLEAVLREIERVKAQAEQRQARPAPSDRPRHIESTARPRHLETTDRPRHVESTERPRRIEAVAKPRPAGGRPRQLSNTDRLGRPKRVQDDRGPFGRHSSTRLPSSEEFEDTTSLESSSLEVDAGLENLDETRLRSREPVDQDDGAEAIVQRRIREAQARNRAFSEQDHRQFHEKLNRSEAAEGRRGGYSAQQLRQAFVWREILGPPKALE